jgi:hypothetical protein
LLYCITAVAGRWCNTAKSKTVVDPLNGEAFMTVPDTQVNEIDHFIQSLQACSKSGLHNPLKNPERCENLCHWCFTTFELNGILLMPAPVAWYCTALCTLLV